MLCVSFDGFDFKMQLEHASFALGGLKVSFV